MCKELCVKSKELSLLVLLLCMPCMSCSWTSAGKVWTAPALCATLQFSRNIEIKCLNYLREKWSALSCSSLQSSFRLLVLLCPSPLLLLIYSFNSSCVQHTNLFVKKMCHYHQEKWVGRNKDVCHLMVYKKGTSAVPWKIKVEREIEAGIYMCVSCWWGVITAVFWQK